MNNDTANAILSHKLLCALAGLLLTSVAEADPIIYHNGPPSLNGGNNMGIAWQADIFKLLAKERVTGIQFWTLEAPGEYRNSISWQIRNDASSSPGNTVFAGIDGYTGPNRMATGRTVTIDAIGYTEYAYTFSITPLTLDAGDYWLNLHNGELANLGDPNDFLWSWAENSPATVTGMESFDLGANWSGNFNHHAFAITVPEPGTLGLLALGLAAWGTIRSRMTGSNPTPLKVKPK